MTSVERGNDESATTTSWSIFAFLWAAAHLMHQAKKFAIFDLDLDAAGGVRLLMNLAAIAVLLRPSSIARFAVMLVIQLVLAGQQMPYVTNHWVFVTLTNLTIGGCLLYGLRDRNTGGADQRALWGRVGPLLRLNLLVLYFYVTLTKINWDFLNPEHSCAVEMFDWLQSKFGVDVLGLPGAPQFAIWSTLALEGGIPLLLIFRRTRPLGIVIGWAFHSMLAVNAFFAFQAMVFAMYVAFTPSDLGARLERVLVRYPAIGAPARAIGAIARRPFVLPASAIALIALAWGPAAIDADLAVVDRAFYYGGNALLLGYGAVAAAVYAASLWVDRSATDERLRFMPRPAFLLVFPLIVFLNGSSQFLGLKTEGSFAMFANLRTEGELWNHCLLPQSIRIFGLQDDLVSVRSSSHPELQAFADDETRVVWLEFRKTLLLERFADAQITYEYKGQEHVVGRIGDDELLSEPFHPLVAKLIWFRPVPKTMHCQH